MDDLDNIVRRLLRSRGITASEAATLTGVNPATVSRILSRKVDPRWSTVRQILEGLDVSGIELDALDDKIAEKREDEFLDRLADRVIERARQRRVSLPKEER